MEEKQTIKLDLVKSTKRSLVYSNVALGISSFKVPKPLVDSDAPIHVGVTFEIASDAMSTESSIDDLRSKLVTRLQKDKELRGRIRKLEKTCQHDWVSRDCKGYTERWCLSCGKKEKTRETSFVQCEICSETKQLSPDVKLKGWWGIAQKKSGGFSSRPLTTGLKMGERAACGVAHLMVLCERATRGSLDKTVYPDNNQKSVVVAVPEVSIEPVDDEPTTNEGQQCEESPLEQQPVESVTPTRVESPVIDDVPPDPTVQPDLDIPTLAENEQVTKFHVLPFLVRLVNKHMRPSLEEFPFPPPEFGGKIGIWDEQPT